MTYAYLTISISGTLITFGMALVFMAVFKLRQLSDPSLNERRAAHSSPTSRLGGVAVCAGVFISILLTGNRMDLLIFIAAFPIFFIGLLEDLRLHTSPMLRLAIGAVSAGIYIFLTGYTVQSLSLTYLDYVLQWMLVSSLVTTFGVIGLINALNFIDGVNGLASGKSIVVATFTGLLAIEYSEPNIVLLCAAVGSSALGLFMLNYPHGRIFMGDAGAYTIGFLLATCLITLHVRHPEIAPWSIILIIFWPLADMAHSITRRVLSKRRSDRPDMMHMHHVVMRSIMALSNRTLPMSAANPIATAIILPMSLIPVIFGFLLRENNGASFVMTVVFAAGFTILHARLVTYVKKSRH